ncbi:bifunctional diguanylate cyclase/phosphodiesterase [Paenibacillus rigui]|uniref:bifunctional diguanylate cyclase/phosphodiesterase n=1 Tax=Paenibacillus rigui TaxID=554312 RepID=UPI001FE85D9D|nr:bifunctional diguanylate cyclase/phosphodiesterase [Paenibacillus rigui]
MVHLQGHYNVPIVLLSFLIAVLASYSAFSLSEKIAKSKGRSRVVWLLAGSCVMGCGVWSMHFVGMLAFHLNVRVTYDIQVTFLSLLASIAASFIAFRVSADAHAGPLRIGVAGLFMGSGIVTMHYTGMAAVRTSAVLTYHPVYVGLSVLIALTASYAALFMFRQSRVSVNFRRCRPVCALVMGLAICGMHYTGMAASHFTVNEQSLTDGGVVMTPMFLLIGVALSTFFILAVSWAAIFFDRNVLEKMAYTDALTGLPNRHHLVRYFEESFGSPSSGFLLFIDLDRFKSINDTLGHDIGDLLLQEVASRLKKHLNERQTAFRLGGDEFLIASTRGDRTAAVQLASTLVQEIKRPYYIQGNELYVTGSIGVSLVPEHGTERVTLLKASDTAMYNAKSSGKNNYRVFDEEMDRKLLRKLELEMDLRKGLAEKQFIVDYQPKWDVETDQISGMEALLRWNHPRLGLVSPGEFVPIAEETGIIVPITRWVLQVVCLQNKIWQDEGLLKVCVSINMSIRVFESGSLYEMVTEALEVSGLKPEYLELEITESIAMYDVEDTIEQLTALRDLGVQVSMDDFGTGYSSLGSLDQMPINTLKIDQMFIRDSNLPSKQAIISTIISIAKNLKLDVVAEGVESPEQIEFLQSQGCRVMQGYYYGKPMNPEKLKEWIGEQKEVKLKT